MSTRSFEFSAAEAKETPKAKLTAETTAKLNLSLEEISKKNREELKAKRKEERKEKQEKRGDKKDKKDKNDKKDKKDKKDKNNKKDKKDKKSKDNKPNKKEKIIKLDKVISENVLKDILKVAGIDTKGYNVSLRAVPKSLD